MPFIFFILNVNAIDMQMNSYDCNFNFGSGPCFKGSCYNSNNAYMNFCYNQNLCYDKNDCYKKDYRCDCNKSCSSKNLCYDHTHCYDELPCYDDDVYKKEIFCIDFEKEQECNTGCVKFHSYCLGGSYKEYCCKDLACLPDILRCKKEGGLFSLFDVFLTGDYEICFDLVECKPEKICCFTETYLEDVRSKLSKGIYDEKVLAYVLKRFYFWLQYDGCYQSLIYLPCAERLLQLDAEAAWNCLVCKMCEDEELKKLFLKFLRKLREEIEPHCKVIQCVPKTNGKCLDVQSGFCQTEEEETPSNGCVNVAPAHCPKKVKTVHLSQYAALVFTDYLTSLRQYVKKCVCPDVPTIQNVVSVIRFTDTATGTMLNSYLYGYSCESEGTSSAVRNGVRRVANVDEKTDKEPNGDETEGTKEEPTDEPTKPNGKPVKTNGQPEKKPNGQPNTNGQPEKQTNGQPAQKPNGKANSNGQPEKKPNGQPDTNGKPTNTNGQPEKQRNGKPSNINGQPEKQTNGKPPNTNGEPPKPPTDQPENNQDQPEQNNPEQLDLKDNQPAENEKGADDQPPENTRQDEEQTLPDKEE